MITISKIELTEDERAKYELIRNIADNGGNKNNVAAKLGITRRQVDRLVAAYKERGEEAFSHGNKGRKPANVMPDAKRDAIVRLYREKYNGANFAHFTELLARNEGIELSVVSVTGILQSAGIYSPKTTRRTKKRIKRELKAKAEGSASKREKAKIQANLVAIEDAHPSRPRSPYAGEMEQLDACPHKWFGDTVTSLHIAVDDATGLITGAWFDRQETLNGYYHVLAQILEKYGIPCMFRTDRRTVFIYKSLKANKGKDEEDTATQFAYACKQLGIAIKPTSVPEAKGRVERMFETLQSRLPVEMRLTGISDMDCANAFLPAFIEQYNSEFALPFKGSKSAFEKAPDAEKINLTLSVLTERTIDSGHCLHFKNKRYRTVDYRGQPVYYGKGTKVMCVEAFDGELYCCVNDADVYALEEVPERSEMSEELDADYKKPEPKAHYIPPMSHPWRKSVFRKFVNAQPHRIEEAVQDYS